MSAESLSDIEVHAYRRAATRHAHRVARTPQDVEDIVGEVMLKVLERPPRNGSVYRSTWRLTIDAVRSLYGRVGTEACAFTKAQFYAARFDEPTFHGEGRPLSETLAAAEPNALQSEIIGLITDRRLPPLQQGILLLQAVWGFTGYELARIFGVTPAYIAQLKGAAVDKTAEIPGGGRGARFCRQSDQREHVDVLLAELAAWKSSDVAQLRTRIRHLEIILEAKGIPHEVS